MDDYQRESAQTRVVAKGTHHISASDNPATPPAIRCVLSGIGLDLPDALDMMKINQENVWTCVRTSWILVDLPVNFGPGLIRFIKRKYRHYTDLSYNDSTSQQSHSLPDSTLAFALPTRRYQVSQAHGLPPSAPLPKCTHPRYTPYCPELSFTIAHTSSRGLWVDSPCVHCREDVPSNEKEGSHEVFAGQ